MSKHVELFDDNPMEEIVQAANNGEEDLSPEELAIDESLSPIEKLNFYINSDLVLHRQVKS